MNTHIIKKFVVRRANSLCWWENCTRGCTDRKRIDGTRKGSNAFNLIEKIGTKNRNSKNTKVFSF